MGEEIQYSHFKQSDYHRFYQDLEQETELVKQWFDNHAFSTEPLVAGYELEAWLINEEGKPAGINEQFLDAMNNDLLSPELATFNVELNVDPQQLTGNVLSSFESTLNTLWLQCESTTRQFNAHILGVGILPSLEDADLTLDNLSQMDRYRALNEQVLRHRKGMEIKLNINGESNLQVSHRDVMLEAAATSLQIHIQTPQEAAVRYYNTAIALSGVMVAVSANSPCLFGRRLWQETRIPVFEQSVPTGGFGGAAAGPVQRVGFGSDYVRESLYECFRENLEHFPILLPVHYKTPEKDVRHLRLHNGTIWRWNRPLIGYDPDGTPHLRIEHRVCASAPSMIDNIANIAFFYGLVHYYASLNEPMEYAIDFTDAKQNFYRGAQLGLKHKPVWPDNKHESFSKLILDRLLAEAEAGLYKLGIDEVDTRRYLTIIEQRVSSNQTGSQWQLDFLDAHQNNVSKLTLSYQKNQQTGLPVHEWDVETSC